jgi:uncharacterized RDD family membrane protein YckC
MSSNEPPLGSVPPPGEPTPPPPPANPVTVPPPAQSMAPPPPPPPPVGGAAPYAAAPGAPAVGGVGQPGNLLDRFLARLIDGVIVFIPLAILNVILVAASNSWFVANAITAVIDAVVALGYFGYLESNRGQTIGKQVMKLRVYGPDGHSNPTMEQAIRRNIWAGFGILNIIPILGAIASFVLGVVALVLLVIGINGDPQRQHWFDKFAGGTKVVKVG